MLTHEEFRSLAAVVGPCLSVYQPLRGDYAQGTRPEDRVVSALREAERLLVENNLTESECAEMLRPLAKIAANTDWAGRKGTFVMFHTPDCTVTTFVSEALPARVHFAQEFLLLPLLPALMKKRDFWLLALSTGAVRLFRGSPKGLVAVPLPHGVPGSLLEAGGFDQPDHSLKGRSSAGPSVGHMKGVQFGTSSEREIKSDHVHDFFQAIDRGIHALLAADPQPLILAGVGRELAAYRKVNTYAPMLAEAIPGSPDGLRENVLYSRAVELLETWSAHAAEPNEMEMEEAANRGLLTTDPGAVITAAGNGLVHELILDPGAPGYASREEAINWAVLAVTRNSGKVAVLNKTERAGSAGFAAILRFRSVSETGAMAQQMTAAGTALSA